MDRPDREKIAGLLWLHECIEKCLPEYDDCSKCPVSLAKADQILALFDEEEIRKQTREMTLREVGEWLDTKWVSYGTFAFIKLSDEEMKALKQGTKGG